MKYIIHVARSANSARSAFYAFSSNHEMIVSHYRELRIDIPDEIHYFVSEDDAAIECRLHGLENVKFDYATNTRVMTWRRVEAIMSAKVVMKVSSILLDGCTKTIQTKTDALRMILTEADRGKYIRDFGDVEIVQKGDHTFHVPEFADQIDQYSAMKQRECNMYGSN